MFFVNNYYYFILGLQAVCVIHCLRKNNQGKWIWLIVFLPLIGCMIYIFSEILTGREINRVSSGVGAMINPSGSIKKLEAKLRFSNTFENKVALADAYLATGQTEKAIELYESSLTGYFAENEYAASQLIAAYASVKRYENVLPWAKKIYRSPQFLRSRAHMLYAIALEHTGNKEQAEKEFKIMSAKFAYFEPRYHYGLFLMREDRIEEARQLFSEILAEKNHLSARERRYASIWFHKTKEELKNIESSKKTV